MLFLLISPFFKANHLIFKKLYPKLTLIYYFLFLFVQIIENLINLPLSLISKIDEDEYGKLSFSFIAAFSFAFTIIALLIGALISPKSLFPLTPQMLISNVIFDSLTVLITFILLYWSIQKNSTFRIPIAIIADLLIAAVFACLSLYFGLIGTGNDLTITEITNILFAKSTDGNKFDLGPYFWAMHTTFIPTIFYLATIFFALIGKYVTLPILGLLKQGGNAEKPHLATGSTFAFIGGVLIGIVKMIEYFN